MTKKFISLFAILLLLGAPSMSFAESEQTQAEEKQEVVEFQEIDFDSDSYDVDGCYC